MDKNPAMVSSCSGIHHYYDVASYVDALLPFPLYINILLFTNQIQINETGDRGGNIWLYMQKVLLQSYVRYSRARPPVCITKTR
jgi:hypothetical protein